MSDQQAKLSEQEMKTYRVQGFTCANCAGKFENNVKQLSGVEDATVNFGASKIYVYVHSTIEELEKAGAFEKRKVNPEKSAHNVSQEATDDTKEKKVPFYKKNRTRLYETSIIRS